MNDFLAMGGYAGYVWPAFGLTVVVLLVNIWSARRTLALARRDALRRVAARGGGA
ncbi:MAG: heme exporter protein CcmD [Steroidobacteraceae bacterium]